MLKPRGTQGDAHSYEGNKTPELTTKMTVATHRGLRHKGETNNQKAKQNNLGTKESL